MAISYKDKVEEDNTYILSTKASLKFSKEGKLDKINALVDEYRRVTSLFVDILWPIDFKDIPPLLTIEITSKVDTWLSKRLVQSAGKQASGIVRGTKKKQVKRLAQVEKFKQEGMFKKARKLQRICDKVVMSKPKIQEVCPELDSRFVDINLNNDTVFDGWVTLSSLTNKETEKMEIRLPFKKTKHFNKMLQMGYIKKGVRLSKSSITFMFNIEKAPLRTTGITLGLDVGMKTALSFSNGVTSGKDVHGHDLDSICKKLCRKLKGSKAFWRAQQHRDNHINWCFNLIDFTGVKRLNIEKIENLRKGKKTSRYLSHFVYTKDKEKLDRLLPKTGVLLGEYSPAYTSQRCSRCGWTRKANRKGKKFVCTACGFACDADINASVNLSLDLCEIGRKERLKHKNKKGFFWYALGQEPIVPVVQRVV